MSDIKAIAVLTCPKCGKSQTVEMPINACQHFYKCVHCGEMLKPKEGDCCVFCSFADTKCPPKQLECKNLTDDNYGSLGEYFMGKMAGSSHEAMNTMMERMMGKEVEEQMHVVMGKRMSGCDTSATSPSSSIGFMPMMNMMIWMMGGGGNPMIGYGGWNNMMGGWGGFGFGWVFMILFWGVLILAIIALLKWLLKGSREQSNRTPLDILQKRFAKGEIDKKEYEEKAKILSKHA